jgi:hypothetical protein
VLGVTMLETQESTWRWVESDRRVEHHGKKHEKTWKIMDNSSSGDPSQQESDQFLPIPRLEETL